jgi:hypothetical protein
MSSTIQFSFNDNVDMPQLASVLYCQLTVASWPVILVGVAHLLMTNEPIEMSSLYNISDTLKRRN